MARLIAVSIDCRNEAARQTFEEIVSPPARLFGDQRAGDRRGGHVVARIGRISSATDVRSCS